MTDADTPMRGWPRQHGREGIGDVVAVACLVDGAHHIARAIAAEDAAAAHVTGCPGCFPNSHARRMLQRLCTLPDGGAVPIVSLGFGRCAAGNVGGGLITIEENALGACVKSGQSKISGRIRPGDIPPRDGRGLMDGVPDGELRLGFPDTSDSAEIAETMVLGALCTPFVTGRGSVVGSALAPVIKIAATPHMYLREAEDMDFNPGRVPEEAVTRDEIGAPIFERFVALARDEASASQTLSRQEFIRSCKSFEPTGPACLPA